MIDKRNHNIGLFNLKKKKWYLKSFISNIRFALYDRINVTDETS